MADLCCKPRARPGFQVLVVILLWVLTREWLQQGNSSTPRGCSVCAPPRKMEEERCSLKCKSPNKVISRVVYSFFKKISFDCSE